MAGIDYNLVNPTRQPGGEVASMAEMLNLIAERRQKNAQLAAARDLAERQYQTEKENKRLDNERADAQLQFSRDQDRGNQMHQRDLFEAAQRKEGLAQAAEGAKLALPAIDAGNMDAARTAVTTHGGTMVPQSPSVLEAPPPLPPPEQVPAQPLTTAEPPLQSSVFPPRPEDIPHAGISVASDTMNDNANARATADWAGRNAAAAAAVQKQNEDAAAAAKHISQIQFPGTAPILYSDQAQQGADDVRDKRMQAQLTAAGGSAVPYAQEGAAAAAVIAPFRKTEGEVGTDLASQMDKARAEAAARERAQIMAKTKTDTEAHRDRVANQTAFKTFQNDQRRFVADHRLVQLNKDYDEAGKAEHLMGSTAPGQKGAVEKFNSSVRGGMATAYSMKFASTNNAGWWSTMEDRFQALKDGGYSEDSQKAIMAALRDTQEAIKQEVAPVHDSYVSAFYTDEYSGFKKNAENKEQEFFKKFGYKITRDPRAQGMSIVGQRTSADPGAAPARAPAAATPAPGATAPIGARAPTGVPPDEQAVFDEILRMRQETQRMAREREERARKGSGR